jgi:hypothetical protein
VSWFGPYRKIFGRLLLTLAVLAFLFPAAYLVAVLSRKAPPSDEQIDSGYRGSARA